MTDQMALMERAVDREPPQYAAFRPIQYLGSKVRLLDAIVAALDLADPDLGPTLDVFSGSGVVAARLAQTRPVTAVDIQEYARVLAAALLAPARACAENEVNALVERSDAVFESVAGAGCRALSSHEQGAMEAIEDDPRRLCEILEHGSLISLEFDECSPRLVNTLRACRSRT